MSTSRRAPSSRLWQDLSVRLAVALAFADASIVVLALPQIVERLNTSISHVTWVITAYNLALIAGALAIIPFAGRLGSRRALVTGLAVFGVASLGCGAADSLTLLVVLRCVQGAGGALLLCASLPLFGAAARPGESSLAGWAAAAAVGAAIGPAAGGLLTQAFDWRAIFFSQAPVAALAALVILALPHPEPREETERIEAQDVVDSGSANLALLFLSAGLIGALFLVTVLLINVWLLTPLAAAAVVSAIPISTALAERVVRGRSIIALGGAGAILLALGLLGIAFVTHRQIGWMVVALAFCGGGLGLAFPALTAAALRTRGSPTARAAKTVAARDGGLVLGLLVLTPIFVHQLNAAPQRAIPPITVAVVRAPIPDAFKVELGAGLLIVRQRTPSTQVPDLGPLFDRVGAQAGGSHKAQVGALRRQVDSTIQRAVTRGFRRPLIYCAIFALLVLPLLAIRFAHEHRRRGAPAPVV